MLDDILKIPHEFTYWEIFWSFFLILFIYNSLYKFIKGNHFFDGVRGSYGSDAIITCLLYAFFWALIALIPVRYAYDWYHDFEHKKGLIYKGAVEPLHD